VATTIALAVAATRPAGRVAMARMARGFLALLPTSRRERWAFAGVAVTAGVTEEVLYRLFLLNFLRWLWPGGGLRGALVLSAVAFGLVHLYQGVRGVVTTGIAGWLLGAFYLGTRSLVLPMLVHTLVDLRILVLPDLSGVGDEQRDAGGTRVAEQVRQPHVAREAD
jgi:membrane protease YdiL (CAAX protease family)